VIAYSKETFKTGWCTWRSSCFFY